MNPLHRSVSGLALVGALTLVLAGCSEDKIHTISSKDVDEVHPRTTPENVLENIALAHRNLDIDLYRAQFDPGFELRMPDPWAGDDAQTTWDYDMDMETTEDLFETSEWITFELQYETPVRSATEGYPADDGFWQVRAHSINIRLKPTTMADTLAVTNEESIFVFVADPSEDPPTWQVVCQQMFWPDD